MSAETIETANNTENAKTPKQEKVSKIAPINMRMKEIRLRLGLTQKEFSAPMPYAASYMSCIELGERTVTERLLGAICSAYGVCPDWLRTGEGDMFRKSQKGKTTVALALFNSLSEELQDYVLSQMQKLADMEKETREITKHSR